jgi:hypothetical protein
MNDGEHKIFDALTQRGFEVMRRGWPDFLVMTKNWNSGFALEYKSATDSVRPEQERMHSALARFGLKTYIAGPEFNKILHKRGSALILPSDYRELKRKYDVALAEFLDLKALLENVQRDLSVLPVLFEPPSEAQNDIADRGFLVDCQTKKVEDVEKRVAMRQMDAWMNDAAHPANEQPAT